jgi:hypothetical protein
MSGASAMAYSPSRPQNTFDLRLKERERPNEFGQNGKRERNEIEKCNVEKKNTVIPRLTKIIRSGITFVSRNIR